MSSDRPIDPGTVHFGDLRRTAPVGREWGYDRGSPVDRVYIEGFLDRHRELVRGRVLEIGDAEYTKRFGGGRVRASDVLHVRPDVPGVTIVADLERGDGIPSDRFDCMILTQTLQLIFDLRRAIATIHRSLAPGGAVLATVPGISPIDPGEWKDSWHWAFTTHSVRRLFEEAFAPSDVEVRAHGNVLAAVAFLEGLAAEELTHDELLVEDERFQLVITVRAIKERATAP
ncbi:MAG: methyltransferase domain-containing protein [Gemmatimonadales bacterium]